MKKQVYCILRNLTDGSKGDWPLGCTLNCTILQNKVLMLAAYSIARTCGGGSGFFDNFRRFRHYLFLDICSCKNEHNIVSKREYTVQFSRTQQPGAFSANCTNSVHFQPSFGVIFNVSNFNVHVTFFSKINGQKQDIKSRSNSVIFLSNQQPNLHISSTVFCLSSVVPVTIRWHCHLCYRADSI